MESLFAILLPTAYSTSPSLSTLRSLPWHQATLEPLSSLLLPQTLLQIWGPKNHRRHVPGAMGQDGCPIQNRSTKFINKKGWNARWFYTENVEESIWADIDSIGKPNTN
jgi:hypothetical protein